MEDPEDMDQAKQDYHHSEVSIKIDTMDPKPVDHDVDFDYY